MAIEPDPAAALVSIIIPMFNAEATIERAISSCLEQSEPHVEVIVVDDASVDAGHRLVAGVSDSRVRLVQLASNVGPSGARTRAIEESTGRWITVLDADDTYSPTRIERLLQVSREIDDPLCVLVDRWLVVGEDQQPLDVPRNTAPRRGDLELTPVAAIGDRVGGKPFLSRQLLKKSGAQYPPGVRFGEDTAFLIQLLNYPGARLYRLDDSLYRYTHRSGSLTRAADRLDHLGAAYRFLLEDCNLQPDIRAEVIRLEEGLEADRRFESATTALRDRDFGRLFNEMVRHPGLSVRALKSYGRHRRYRSAQRASGQDEELGPR